MIFYIIHQFFGSITLLTQSFAARLDPGNFSSRSQSSYTATAPYSPTIHEVMSHLFGNFLICMIYLTDYLTENSKDLRTNEREQSCIVEIIRLISEWKVFLYHLFSGRY